MALNDKSDFERHPHPTRYQLIDAEGRTWSFLYEKATDAAEAAKSMWPDQEQDVERSGVGWDIQTAGIR